MHRKGKEMEHGFTGRGVLVLLLYMNKPLTSSPQCVSSRGKVSAAEEAQEIKKRIR